VLEYLRKFLDIKEEPRKKVGFKRSDEPWDKLFRTGCGAI